LEGSSRTIAEQIASYASLRGDAAAVTCADETVSWRELSAGAAQMAAHYLEAGATHGDYVTIALPNSVAFVEATLAAWWIGATPVPISSKLPAAERTAIIALAESAVLVTDLEDAPGGGAEVLTLAELRGDPSRSRAGQPAPAPVPSPAWKAVGSGGSTGRPKLIVGVQDAAADAITPIAELLRVPVDSTLLVPGPLSHNAPFISTTFGLLRGNHVVLMPRFDASECLRLAELHRAQWMYQVPTMMLRIWRLPEAERAARDLSSVETVFHMAAPCPPWLKREWIDWLGAETLMELYAGTELQAMTIVRGDDWLAHPGTVGQVHLGEMEIRDEAGQPLPPGEIGEIWMRRGAEEPIPYRYLGATARSAGENWESLGDNGHFEADGYLFLADRSADMILVGGTNVYPAEIEAALDEHPAVRSSCVIGLPNEDLGNVPHALVDLLHEASDEELLSWVRERVAPYKVPKSIERVDQPLRDDAGKVRRSQLRAARLPTSTSSAGA
jgi:bile acid-coenzyme A ligase